MLGGPMFVVQEHFLKSWLSELVFVTALLLAMYLLRVVSTEA